MFGGSKIAKTYCRLFGHGRLGCKVAAPEGLLSLFRWCTRCKAWTNWHVLDTRFLELNARIHVPDHGHREAPVGPIMRALPAGNPGLPERT